MPRRRIQQKTGMGTPRKRPLGSSWMLLLYLAASETAAGHPLTENPWQLRGNIQQERRQQATTVTPLDNLFRQNLLTSTPSTKQANGAGTYLKVDVTFKVGSTSVSETKHNIDIADLTAALNLFATTLTLEWAYRRLEQFPEEEENNDLGNLRSPASIHDEHTGARKRRRLELSAVPESAVIDDENLEDTFGCIVSVTDVGEGEFSHCNQASGSFIVLADEEEDPPRVCWNMEDSVNNLFDDDYLQEALGILAPQSNLKLSEGAFSSCSPVTDFEPPGVAEETNGTSAPAPTSAPTLFPTSTPTSQAPTSIPTTPSNIFNQPGSGANSSSSEPTAIPITSPPAGNETDATNNLPETNTTINPSNAPTVAPTSVDVPTIAPGPVPTGSPTVYQNEWLSVLNGDYEDDPTETGDPWLDALGAAAAEEEEASGGPGTPAPAPVNNSKISEEIARLREAYYDDSTLDFAILILSIVWGSLIFIACCVYAMDAAWIQYRRSLVEAEDKEFFHEGRWYYDENHKFLREDSHEKPPPDGYSQSSMFDLGHESSEDEDDASVFMSSSEDDEDDDDDDDDYFDFDESDGEEDEYDGSEFYVEYGEEDGEEEGEDDFFGDEADLEDEEEEDYFADEVGEETDGSGEESDEEESRGFGDESNESDFFNDESELTDISDIPEQKPEPLLKNKR